MSETTIASLVRRGKATQLVAQGRPRLLLGGELHNSTGSHVRFHGALWAQLKAQGLNTVLVAVAWEQIEPEPGVFDFTSLHDLLEGARAHDLHLVLLWFGSWKNGESSYAPMWLRRDQNSYPRVVTREGRILETLSPFSEATAARDASAFSCLMRELARVDGNVGTVLLVQIENELGVLGDSRDHSTLANAAFHDAVPLALVRAMEEWTHFHAEADSPLLAWWAGRNASGASWAEMFDAGDLTDEIFMAWRYATFVETVARAGKRAYPIPAYVNAWLDSVVDVESAVQLGGGTRPGIYPSGGPVARVHQMWRVAAPSVDILAPDIYFGDADRTMENFAHEDNPLFIPEMARGPIGAGMTFAAIGGHGAIGVSPFGIDSVPGGHDAAIGDAYGMLRALEPYVLAAQAEGAITGFHLTPQRPEHHCELGGYRLTVSADVRTVAEAFGGVRHEVSRGESYGLIMTTGPGAFLAAGRGFAVRFDLAEQGDTQTRIYAAEELTWEHGELVVSRSLNGDETFNGCAWRFGYLERPLDGPDDPMPLPGAMPWTGIARCRVYSRRGHA